MTGPLYHILEEILILWINKIFRNKQKDSVPLFEKGILPLLEIVNMMLLDGIK